MIQLLDKIKKNGKFFFNRSIKAKIILVTMIIVILSASVISIILTAIMINDKKIALKERLEEINVNLNNNIMNNLNFKILNNIQEISKNISKISYFETFDSSQVKGIFDKYFDIYSQISLMNIEGKEVIKLSQKEQLYDLIDFKGDNNFIKLVNDKNNYIISEEFMMENIPSIKILYKSMDEWGDIYCYLSVVVPLEKIISELINKKIGDLGFVALANSSGLILYHKNSDNIFKKLNENGNENSELIKNIIQMKNDFSVCNLNGINGYIYYTPNEYFKWSIISVFPRNEFFKPVINIVIAVIIIIFCSLAISLFIIIFIGNSISVPLMQISDTLQMSSSQIASASNQLSLSSQEIANGATEQASSIEETSSSMEELSSMVKQNSSNAKEASVLSQKTNDISQTGYKRMEEMLESMTEINKSSSDISKIIKVIDDIAFQTNILALNAAVEAARAGEAGMGFAVVADEVKNLANKAAGAAKETAEMIESSIKKTESGLDNTKKLAEIFKEILINAQKVTEVAKEVETASIQQDQGINQVNKAIVQFDEVVQANASSAEETASSAEELLAQVETLNNIVSDLVIVVNGKIIELENKEIKYLDIKEKSVDIKKGGVQNQAPKKLISQKNKSTDIGKKKKEVSPEEIIPFEEDEDFTKF